MMQELKFKNAVLSSPFQYQSPLFATVCGFSMFYLVPCSTGQNQVLKGENKGENEKDQAVLLYAKQNVPHNLNVHIQANTIPAAKEENPNGSREFLHFVGTAI